MMHKVHQVHHMIILKVKCCLKNDEIFVHCFRSSNWDLMDISLIFNCCKIRERLLLVLLLYHVNHPYESSRDVRISLFTNQDVYLLEIACEIILCMFKDVSGWKLEVVIVYEVSYLDSSHCIVPFVLLRKYLCCHTKFIVSFLMVAVQIQSLHYFVYLGKNNTQQVHQRSSPDSLQVIQLALRRGWLLL